MSILLPAIDTVVSPQLIWGLFPRLLGGIYLIALAGLYRQVLPLAGTRGISPIKAQLAQIQHDYPTYKRFCYFPTLLWFNAGDGFLRGLVILGSLSALVAIYGGPYTGLALSVCWLVYLSLDLPVGLPYPWDSLLFEAGFLALFLPPIHALPALAAITLPLPAVAWAYRWLIFRLILGFGKFKFVGASRKDLGYLKGFFINQPIPTYLGWYAYRLPRRLLQAALVGMFFVEVVAPFLIFFKGDPRLMAALAMIGLMITIQLTGNFGFFNLLVIALCFTLFDHQASLFDQPLYSLFTPWPNLVTHGVLLVLFIGSVLYFPFNSWCTQSWLYWPSFLKIRAGWWQRLLACYRGLAPLRLVHAYGVFPPHGDPPVRWIALLEGTADGKVWQEYHYHFLPSNPRSAPVFVAPYHPRLDHALFYESTGGAVDSFFSSTFSLGNPYAFTHTTALMRLAQRLLEGEPSMACFFRHNPFPPTGPPPVAIRATCHMLRPTSPAERQQTGAWWQRDYVAPHLPPMGRDDTLWQRWLPEPARFHWDEVIWRRRSPHLQHWLAADCSAANIPALLCQDGIDAATLTRFWTAFVAGIDRTEYGKWAALPQTVARFRHQFSCQEWDAFERVLARLSLLLAAKLEPHFMGLCEPVLKIDTHFELGLLTHYIISQGPATYAAVMAQPATAIDHAQQMTIETGTFYLGLFWYETLTFQAGKLRLLLRFHPLVHEPAISGFFKLLPFLSGQLVQPAAEHLPTFAQRVTDCEWVINTDELACSK